MNREIGLYWASELRSGKYKQGQKVLCSIEGKNVKYCCLGVLMHIMKVPYKKNEHGNKVYLADGTGYTASLSDSLVKDAEMNDVWGGSKREKFESLCTMNDTGKSFREIAQYIKENVENL